MMLYPPVAELVEKVGSRYQLVNLVARRARALSVTKEGEEPSDRKPVSEAIDEVYTGRLTIVRDGQQIKKDRAELTDRKASAVEEKKAPSEPEVPSQVESVNQPESDAESNEVPETENQEQSEA